MKAGPRAPEFADRHIGMRLRMRRELLNMTHKELAERIGLSFQQARNYEQGMNKIGAGRLWVLSHVLDVPVTYFFEGLAEIGDGPGSKHLPPIPIICSSDLAESAELAQAFADLKDMLVRRRLIELVRTIAAEEVEKRSHST